MKQTVFFAKASTFDSILRFKPCFGDHASGECVVSVFSGQPDLEKGGNSNCERMKANRFRAEIRTNPVRGFMEFAALEGRSDSQIVASAENRIQQTCGQKVKGHEHCRQCIDIF